jgi:small-conductance mechanosensitive channel
MRQSYCDTAGTNGLRYFLPAITANTHVRRAGEPGLQNLASNFISGLILLIERPITVGDHVSAGDVDGIVRAINMRSTEIVTDDNISIIVPNSEFISGRVVNWSHGDPTLRLRLAVGVAYASDVEHVREVLLDVAGRCPDVLASRRPVSSSSASDSRRSTWSCSSGSPTHGTASL